MSEERLPGTIQESVCTAVALVDDDNSSIIANQIEPQFFDEPLNQIVSRCIDHRKKFNRPPGKTHIDDVFSDILEDEGHKQYGALNRTINNMMHIVENLDTAFLLTRVSDFIKLRKLRSSIGNAAEIYQKGGPGVFDDLEHAFREALRIRNESENRDYGFTLADPRAFGFLDRSEADYCLINIPELDNVGCHPARKEMIAFLASRNKGKCLDEDTLLLMPDGSRKTIKDVVYDKDDFIMSLDINNGVLVKTPISEFHDNGPQPCIEITTTTGKNIICTENHPLLTKNGWRVAGELSISDYIASTLKVDNLGQDKTLTSYQARLLGYLIADGGLTKSSNVIFTKIDPIIRQDFEKCVVEMKDQVTWVIDKNNKKAVYGRVVANPLWSENYTLSWLRSLNLQGLKSKHKFVPAIIFTQPDNIICEFLKALFSCDGSIYWNRENINVIDYASASEELIDDIHHLLTRIGIVAYKSRFTAALNNKEFPGYAQLITRSAISLLIFLDKIGFIGEKEKKVDELRLRINSLSYDRFPVHCRKFKFGPEGTRYTGKQLVSKSVMYERIKSIQFVGDRFTYDITVPEHHNFIANDIVSHNSWWLHHCGKYALLKGWRVAHYTLENSAEMTSQRYFQTLFSGVKREGNYHYTSFIEDNAKQVRLQSTILKPAFNIEQKSSTITFLTKKVEEHRYQMENLRIREFATGQLSFDGLQKDLDELAIVHKFEPDEILLDGPTLMRLNRQKPKHEALEDLIQDLRGLAKDRNLAMVVTQQGTRDSGNASRVEDRHGAGSISMFNIADNGITYSQTESEERHGTARLFLQKVRNDAARATVLITQHYASGQFCLDSRYMTDELREKLKAYTGTSDKELDNDEYEFEERKLERVRL